MHAMYYSEKPRVGLNGPLNNSLSLSLTGLKLNFMGLGGLSFFAMPSPVYDNILYCLILKSLDSEKRYLI